MLYLIEMPFLFLKKCMSKVLALGKMSSVGPQKCRALGLALAWKSTVALSGLLATPRFGVTEFHTKLLKVIVSSHYLHLHFVHSLLSLVQSGSSHPQLLPSRSY